MVSTDDVLVRGLRLLAPIIAVGFAVIVAVGLLSADLGSEGREILDLAWGRITLLDTYLAFAVVIVWIWVRQSPLAAAALTVGVIVLGSAVIWGFVAWAAWTSRDRRQLLTGAGDVVRS
jgi:hypothetical protein